MRRVYTVWFIRKATPAAGELAGFGLFINWGLKYVSPENILINAFSASDGLNTFAMFFVRAFMHLSDPSKFALVLGAIFGIIVVRDVWTQLNRLISIRQKLVIPSY